MKERVLWVDTAKGIGLILVILGHLDFPYLPTWIYTFHIPLFFFLSGFVFSEKKYSFGEFLLRKIKSLIVPYFIYATIIYLFYFIINCIIAPEVGLYGSNLDMLIGVLVQKHFWTIWFLACLFFTEIFFYILRRLLSKDLALFIVSMIIVIGGFCYYRFVGEGLPWNIDVVFIAQGFYCIGFLFKKYPKVQNFFIQPNDKFYIIKLLGMLAINIICGSLSILISHRAFDMSVGLYGFEPLSIISAVAGIMFTIMVSSKFKFKPLIYLGQNTMLIFALHSRVVIVGCRYLFQSLGIFQSGDLISAICFSIITLIVIFVTLLPLTVLLKKTKVSFIFGL